MKNNLLIVLCTLLCLISSCVKDKKVFTPDQGSIYRSSILGMVLDETNNPIQDATVTYQNKSQKTDKNGVYYFKNVDISARHSSLTISKDGYFNGNRVFSASRAGSTINLKTILLKKDFIYGFEAGAGGKINTKDKVELNFPASAVMIESTGADYTGQVQAAIKYIDPTGENLLFEMPGNLSGFNSNQETRILTTYGMVAVELQSPAGQKLNVKTGMQVEMSAEVPAKLLAKAPTHIPLWHFDESTGYWQEEGSAQLENGRYIGKVSHFSCWNYDVQQPSIIVSGRVIDQDGNPVAGAYIMFCVSGAYSGGGGTTNHDGTYSGPIEKDQILTVTVYGLSSSICPNDILYSGQVGSFSNDVTLPDIVVSVPVSHTLSVTGSFTDCTGNPVQEGYIMIKLNDVIIGTASVENGQASASFIACSASGNYTATAVDLTRLKETGPIPLSLGANDLGMVTICGSEVDHLVIDCPNLHLHQVMTSGLFVSMDGELKVIKAYIDYNDSTNVIFMGYRDGDLNNYAIGTHPLHDVRFFIEGNGFQRLYALVTGGNNTITITQGGATGGKVTGTFSFDASNNGVQETFTGSFRIQSK